MTHGQEGLKEGTPDYRLDSSWIEAGLLPRWCGESALGCSPPAHNSFGIGAIASVADYNTTLSVSCM